MSDSGLRFINQTALALLQWHLVESAPNQIGIFNSKMKCDWRPRLKKPSKVLCSLHNWKPNTRPSAANPIMSKWATFSGHRGDTIKPISIITNAPGLSVQWSKSAKSPKWVRKMVLCRGNACPAQDITLANPWKNGFQCGMMSQVCELQAIAAHIALNQLPKWATNHCLQHPIGQHTHKRVMKWHNPKPLPMPLF